MTTEPDYIVVRRGPDMPAEWALPDGLDGKWFDLSRIPVAVSRPAPDGGAVTVSLAAAVPTGRFEVRGDGAVAEVWELRPKYAG